MASSFVASVDSALQDLEMLLNIDILNPRNQHKVKNLRLSLKKLKTFVLFARKWGDVVHLRSDGSQESLFVRTEDVLARKAQEIHLFCLDLTAKVRYLIEFDIETKDIQSLEEEIDDRYMAMLDYKRQSSSLTTGEVVEIIDSILETIVDFLCFSSITSYVESLVKAMEALREQMAFLKNLICFATLPSTEHGRMEDLLTHSEAAALNAAHLCIMCRVDELWFQDRWPVENWWKVENDEICGNVSYQTSILVQKIKPVSPQVYQTYTQALAIPNLSISATDDAIIVMKNFLDSLISNLWEILQLDDSPVVCLKNQLKELYEGLRFLRTILKKKPNNFNEKIRDHIGVVIQSAGVLVCSVYQSHVETDFGLQHLLERVKVIRAEAGDEILQTSMFNFPRTNELGFLDCLLENLMEVSIFDAESITKSYAQTLQDELAFLRSFLGGTVELHNEPKGVQTLWNRVLEMGYRAESLVECLGAGDVSSTISLSLYSIIEDIRNIKSDALMIFRGKRDSQVLSKTRKSSHVPPSITNEFVGFHDEATSIIDRLTRGSKKLRVISIIGMPGQGKTTLAAKVYNDTYVTSYFHVRAWCPVSQVLDKKKVLLELLSHIDPGRCSEEMTEQDVTEMLWRQLKGKRYLIFLDDIWTIEAWNILQGAFPDDSVGSRIILTSRVHDAVPHYMVDKEPHFLRQLTSSESWELLQRKLFPGTDWPLALHELGMEIAECCKGLPLTIVIVAGLLAATEQEDWKKILDGFSSGVVSSTEQCMNTLDLSYKHLPDYLKPCLLYFGVFPEDQEVSVRRLIRLWIAEGFVRGTKLKNLEEAAEDCMMSLIGRSLVMVAKQRSIGGIKTCRIHDLIRDFCFKKATEEHFFHLLKGYDQLLAFNEPCNLWRLCIYAQPKHFKESKLYCPRARSLLFFSQEMPWYRPSWLDISFVIRIFKVLRVLDFELINVGSVFPSEIELLAELRYFAIRGDFEAVPSSIGNLSNLETFILVVECLAEPVSLPDTLWNLQKLKFLSFRVVYFYSGVSWPPENLDNSSVLYELDRLSGVQFYSWDCMAKQMRKFPNICKLKCDLFESRDGTGTFDKIIVPDFLNRLESLHLCFSTSHHDKILEISLPTNMKKLTLLGSGLAWSAISSIGKLPNLEVLKLLRGSVSGETWEMEEGEFSKLRFLKFVALDIVSWTASYDLICFQKLVLVGCKRLKEIPPCLEYIPTLEMIEVSYCSDTTESLVKHIEKEQRDMGNSDLKVLIIQSLN